MLLGYNVPTSVLLRASFGLHRLLLRSPADCRPVQPRLLQTFRLGFRARPCLILDRIEQGYGIL